MSSAPPFLAYLKLDTSADERAVRRAYAQALKTIDQATQPGDFQQLRSAYEAALAWARRREPSPTAQPADTQPSSPQLAPQPPLPQAPDRAVSAAPDLSDTPTTVPSAGPETVIQDLLADIRQQAANFTSTRDARTSLDAALQQARSLHLDASFLLERSLVQLLARGWHPGHEYLFDAAATAFAWEADGLRLRRLGSVGAMLDSALRERAEQADVPAVRREQQRHFLTLLKTHATLPPRTLAEALPLVRAAAHFYPNWVRITTHVDRIEEWERLETLEADTAPRSEDLARTPGSGQESRQRTPWKLIASFAVFVLLVLSFPIIQQAAKERAEASAPAFAPQATPHQPTPLAAPTPGTPPAPGTNAIAPQRVTILTHGEKIAYAIRAHIFYEHKGQENPRAEVTVRTAPDGRILGRALTQSSGVPQWDAAVLHAIDLTGTLPLDASGHIPDRIVIGFRPR